jgi:hypothetical protein
MTPEEARAHIQKQNADLAALEAEVARLAGANPTPVLMAILRGLVEIVCGAQGDVFRQHNKIKFYSGVLMILRSKGIQ